MVEKRVENFILKTPGGRERGGGMGEGIVVLAGTNSLCTARDRERETEKEMELLKDRERKRAIQSVSGRSRIPP